MPTAGDIQRLGATPRRSEQPFSGVRTFRERLLDLAGEHEALQARYDTLVLGHQELKVNLELVSVKPARQADDPSEPEIAQLKEQASRSCEAEAEAQRLRDCVSALEGEVSELRERACEGEGRRAEAEAAAEAEAQRADQARLRLEAQARAAEEERRVEEQRAVEAEARAERAEADLRDLRLKTTKRDAGDAGAGAQRPAAAKDVSPTPASEAEASDGRTDRDAEVKASQARRSAEARTREDADAKASEDAKQHDATRFKEEAVTEDIPSTGPVEQERDGMIGGTAAVELNPSQGKAVREKEPASIKRKTAKLPVLAEKRTDDDRKESIARALPNLGKLYDSDWHGSYEHISTAKARIFVFYGAGDKGSRFQGWQGIVKRHFPDIEMVVFEYPGHGRQKGADLASDVSALEQEFTQQVIQYKDGFQNYFNCPFAMVGLSAGARLGVHLLQKLVSIGARPEKFYVVGRSPPLVPCDPPIPASTEEFFNYIGNNLVSSKETYEMILEDMTQLERQVEEQIWRADIAMNSSPVPQLPRKWRVRNGKLIKRPDSDLARRIQIMRDPGSEVFVTGVEQRGKGGERWLQIDTERDAVKPGWWLVHGASVGIQEELLEPVENDDPLDEQSKFWEAPVSFQIHYSTGDRIAPNQDATGQHRPMREWSRLTSSEPEFVEHEGLPHGELLVNQDVLQYILGDFVRCCRLR